MATFICARCAKPFGRSPCYKPKFCSTACANPTERPFTPEEDDAITAGWGHITAARIGEPLGRGKRSIISRAGRLGLSKASPYKVVRKLKFFLPKPATLETTGEVAGVRNGVKLAGWNDINRYWHDNGGKGWPEIGQVNDMRRRHGRPPYKPMTGLLATGAA